jgi:hypothetical protein
MRREALLIVGLGMLATACGAGGIGQLPPPDHPVPASEPRAQVSARVDLRPARDCEEAFDLALYQDRAIELIAWDDNAGTCQDRHVSIRYLSRRLTKTQVVEQVRRHADRVAVYQEKESTDDASK